MRRKRRSIDVTLQSIAITVATGLPAAIGAAALIQRRRWFKSTHCCWLTISLLTTTLAWFLYTPLVALATDPLARLIERPHLNLQLGVAFVLIGTGTLSIHLLASIGALSRNERKRTQSVIYLALAISWSAYLGPFEIHFVNQLAITAAITYFAGITCQIALQIRSVSHKGTTARKIALCFFGVGATWITGSAVNLAAAIFPCISTSPQYYAVLASTLIIISTLMYTASRLSYRAFAKPLVIPDNVPEEWSAGQNDNG
ncbi:membrane protein [Gordonia phage Octobien14]|uniref:Membrane protein n=1 Tax=Gordonia phage Octobien14 TaxID=2483673 RepID=A0A3G3M9K2_9CAUD|nr:membrane protein [Gordonia phage Octobien14]AYR03190.1 membrane protein [Gordonia phage Octobien14]